MAESDYQVADRPGWQGSDTVTAADKVAETVQATPDSDAWAAADTANVSHPAYVGYATALAAHEAREDIESLASRRARENGDAFTDADYMRNSLDQSTRPGTTAGLAPKEA
jgi:hypothetical protein